MKLLTSSAMIIVGLVTTAQAQTTPEEVAAQLQAQGVTDIVVYAGRGSIRATGDNNGTPVDVSFDRRTGEEIDVEARREERAEVRSFVEGLRESYDPETDGSFRSYVAEAAAEAGIDLPERGGRGPGRGERDADDATTDRPERGDRGERGGAGGRGGAGERGNG